MQAGRQGKHVQIIKKWLKIETHILDSLIQHLCIFFYLHSKYVENQTQNIKCCSLKLGRFLISILYLYLFCFICGLLFHKPFMHKCLIDMIYLDFNFGIHKPTSFARIHNYIIVQTLQNLMVLDSFDNFFCWYKTFYSAHTFFHVCAYIFLFLTLGQLMSWTNNGLHVYIFVTQRDKISALKLVTFDFYFLDNMNFSQKKNYLSSSKL